METKRKLAREGVLARTKQRFDQWRRTRKRRGPIPVELWHMAAEVATVHGVHSTARRLRLNSTQLRRQMEALGKTEASQDGPRFVELPCLAAAPVPECILEAEDQAGRKLRIHLKAAATTQAALLGRMLWSAYR
jgi:hypothetical protein